MFGMALIAMIVSGFAFAGENPDRKKTNRSNQQFEIKARSWGPTQIETDAAKQRAEKSDAVRGVLKGAKYRLLGFEYVNRESDAAGAPPTHFRVLFYNYTEDSAVIAEGDFAGRESISVRVEPFDPGVSEEEIKAAYGVLGLDPQLGPIYREGKLELYEAMPPVSNLTGERLVNIGVRNLNSGDNQIVGISFKNDRIIRFENNAPPMSRATPAGCGIPSAGQGSLGPGVAGQSVITASEQGNPVPVWEMLVVRPSASSGAPFERSGIEVRDVKYRGKSVLKRGHAPVLNVQYVSGCGPFRDWQYGEGFFQIPTSGVTFPNGETGGFALISSGIATTSVETRNDSGNFRGVAVYQQDSGFGQELVMVSELNAGWYRYVMEWRFGFDGRIRPRYGFASTSNSCVCIQRNHHVYWRLDFDVVSPTNKIFLMERGRKFLTPVATETAMFRNTQRNRGFLIQNSTSDEAYSITPNPNDGTVTNAQGILTDNYGAGDFWLFRFQGTAASPSELDDPNSGSAINVAPWLTGESLVNQDVVIWYGAHQTRVDDTSLTAGSNQILAGFHVIGPDIRPVRW